MKKGIKYSLIIPGWFILGVLILLVLTGLLIQTGPVKQKIIAIAEKQVPRFINGNLTFGKIDGNFFTHLSIKNIQLVSANDTIAVIGQINARYNLWALRHKTLEIDTLEIIDPRILLKQLDDTTWNVQHILKTRPVKKKSESSATSAFRVLLPVFRLVNGNISVQANDSLIPRKIENLNTALSAFWTENGQRLQLKHFSFNTIRPDFRMNQLEFLLTRDNRFISLKDFRLQTAKNLLQGNAEFENEAAKKGLAAFEISPIETQEFSFFLPDIKIAARPKIKINAGMDHDSTWAVVEMTENNQQIHFQFSSDNLEDYLLNSSKNELNYLVTGVFGDVEPGSWLENPGLNYIIDGQILVKGRGFNPASANVHISGRLNDWMRKKHTRSDKIDFTAQLDHGNLEGRLEASGSFGKVNLNSVIQNFTGIPAYQINLITRNLNLRQLTGIDDLQSDINLSAIVSGREFNPEKLTASAQIDLSGSHLQNVQLNNLKAGIRYKNENIQIDTFYAETQTTTFSAKGNYSFSAKSDLQVRAEFSGMEELGHWLPIEKLQTSGKVEARLWGTPDSLNLESQVMLNPTQLGEQSLNQLNLAATGRLTPDDTLMTVSLSAFGLNSGNFTVDSLTARVDGNTDSLCLSAYLFAGDFSSHLQSGIVPGDKTKITINNWNIQYQNQNWALQQPPAIIEIEPDKYQITNFLLASNEAINPQFIMANGIIDLAGKEDFLIETGRINLEKLSEMFGLEKPVSGLFNFALNLEGTATSPVIRGGYSLDQAAFDQFRLNRFDGNFSYSENLFTLKSEVLPENAGKIEIEASLPLQARLDSINFQLNFNDSLNARLSIKNLSLDLLKSLDINEDISGYIEGFTEISGTMNDPLLTGNFSLKETVVNGYRLTQFDHFVNYANKLFSLHSHLVTQDSGKFSVDASLPMHFNPDSLQFVFHPSDSVNGNVKIENFSLAVLQAMNPVGNIAGMIEGEIKLSGTVEAPNPVGNLRLVNASAQIKEYGVDYRDIRLNLNFLRDKVILDDIRINSRDGQVTGKGRIDFTSDFYKGNISRSDIQLDFNRFQPFNHRQFNIQVSGNANLGGEKGNVVYGGQVTIPRAELFIPAILRLMGKMSLPELPKPMLVREAVQLSVFIDSTKANSESFQPDSSAFDYFDQFSGRLRIKIPRNTWIKNDDLYIEISGDVELIKNHDYFELFGSVDVVRGQYDILGKTFVIDDGTINFQGGEGFDLQMNINASYTFRNSQRAQQKLSVNIKGTTQSPEVEFTLDGNPVGEGDALSYILFGKSINELTINEQDKVTGAGGGSLAGKAAASILSSQIANFLGDKLNLDYIEVKSDGTFENATVVVGKYITNDLFVSYQQRFGETHEKNIAKYEVKLEYELFRFLFFELNNSSNDSGFDIILKFDVN